MSQFLEAALKQVPVAGIGFSVGDELTPALREAILDLPESA